MCFHATDYKHTDFTVDPHIIATETNGGLVLLRVVLADHLSPMNFPHYGEFLVYDASGPSLDHLPCPSHILFSDESVAFVRKCTQGASHDYVLAAHSGEIGYGEPSQLFLYHSDTKTWAKKPLVVKKPSSDPGAYHSTCKAVTIGGDTGTVAWVDLWHNIIVCNVLARRPRLHYLELPGQAAGEILGGDPSSIRDIAFLDGLFKFAEMQFHDQPGAYWEAKVWITKPSSSSAKDWIAKYEFKSSDISELPGLHVGPGRAHPTLSTLHTGLPNLSLQDDDIVYFLSKVYHRNNKHTAWVLPVNMKSKTVEVGEFNPMRTLGLTRGYSATRISKYLKRLMHIFLLEARSYHHMPHP
uniref:Uncharacterized protein n=2 Tax=Avena sativa TaxID=4498 RepID=A0ACD5WVH4_AVESA